ncbi:MAG: hypothetical protein CVT73_00825 [Alphaproteobacteria bacterium HGW-Alphaproteobacteria-12]|nr:MAG: hypothetical protein CVT73_00825 [Alphaproteobacteria bacterium HGW-Alphaproteobacteria-12]
MRFKTVALAAPLFIAGALLAGCSSANDIGPVPEETGPMGSTATPSQADLPAKNSQSTPIVRPE